MAQYRIELDGAAIETVHAATAREALAAVDAQDDPAIVAVKLLPAAYASNAAIDNEGLIVDSETAAYRMLAAEGYNFSGSIVG